MKVQVQKIFRQYMAPQRNKKKQTVVAWNSQSKILCRGQWQYDWQLLISQETTSEDLPMRLFLKD